MALGHISQVDALHDIKNTAFNGFLVQNNTLDGGHRWLLQ